MYVQIVAYAMYIHVYVLRTCAWCVHIYERTFYVQRCVDVRAYNVNQCTFNHADCIHARINLRIYAYTFTREAGYVAGTADSVDRQPLAICYVLYHSYVDMDEGL